VKTKVFTTHNFDKKKKRKEKKKKPSQTAPQNREHPLPIIPPLSLLPPNWGWLTPPAPPHPPPPPPLPLLAQLRQQDKRRGRFQRRTSATFRIVFSPLGTDGPYWNVRQLTSPATFAFVCHIQADSIFTERFNRNQTAHIVRNQR
jgi:hypothetical protein